MTSPEAGVTDGAPRPWLLLCCVLVVVAGCYLPVLGAPFMWDDSHLVQSPLVRELHPLTDYFSGSFWQRDDLAVARSYYRPLSVLSLALDQRLFGANPGGFHLTNLTWHLLAVGLLFALLRRQGANGYLAALGSACWGLYPRLTEAAAWVSGRTDVLAGCFVLAGLLAQRRAGTAARWLSAGFLLLGLFCKETALAGFLAVAVMELTGTSSMAERARRLIPASSALALYAGLRLHALGAGGTALPLSFAERATAIFEAVGRYAWMLAAPWLPDAQIGRLRERVPLFVLLGAGLLGMGLVLLWRYRARLISLDLGHFTLALSAWGLALYAIPFSVTSVAADRFLYLPLAGVVLLAEPVLSHWATKTRLLLPSLTALALSFGGATFLRAQVWTNEVELWASTLRRHPEAPSLASVTLGSAFSRQGSFDHALALFERGSRPGMDCEELGRNNIGTTYLRVGRYEEAAHIFSELSNMRPGAGLYAVNLALADAYLERFAEAHSALDQLLAVSPGDTAARSLRDRLPALEASRRQLAALPSSAAPFERAQLQASVGLTHEALVTFRTALLAPSATAAQAEEATWLSLREGGSTTTEDFFARYAALASNQVDAQLQLAYENHRDVLADLQRVWPTLP